MGAELFQQDVGGDLEDAVGDEEDDEGRVELDAVCAEPEVLGQVKDVCVGDVDAVCAGGGPSVGQA